VRDDALIWAQLHLLRKGRDGSTKEKCPGASEGRGHRGKLLCFMPERRKQTDTTSENAKISVNASITVPPASRATSLVKGVQKMGIQMDRMAGGRHR
jgi:hypothetical protein